ncbi:MAG: NUDIX domain-containing protein [Candidatus Diapherotrites archaeon]
MDYRKNSSAIVIYKGKILITKKPNRDSWQFPQGGIKENETGEEAILRELKEELNITKVEIVGKSKIVHQYDWSPEKQKQTGLQGIRQRIYYIRLLDDPMKMKIDPTELEKFQWIESENIHPFFKFQNLLDLLNNIQEEMSEMVRRYQ